MGINVEYPDYPTALAAPLFRIETWIEDEIVDGIGIGACEWHCDASQTEQCLGQPVKDEHVSSITYDENGMFEGGAVSERVWLGVGCTYCTFADGFNFAICP